MSKKHKAPATTIQGIFLDFLEESTLKGCQKRGRDLLSCYWQSYSDLVQQRSQIFQDLLTSLRGSVKKYPIEKYSRIVNNKYSLDPLSTIGSVLKPYGNRFNIGGIEDTGKFQPFNALYIAQDDDAAHAEYFNVDAISPELGKVLSPEEVSLNKKSNYSHYVVSGMLEEVVEIANAKPFEQFLSTINKINYSHSTTNLFKLHGLTPEVTIKSFRQLKSALLEPKWQIYPALYEIPSTSQIFGQLVFQAGIQGIVYPSTKYPGKKCIVIYPENFKDNDSVVYLDSIATLNPHITKTKIDKDTFRLFI